MHAKAFEYAAKEALKKEDGTYEIKIMQNVADFDLSHDSEENARGKGASQVFGQLIKLATGVIIRLSSFGR